MHCSVYEANIFKPIVIFGCIAILFRFFFTDNTPKTCDFKHLKNVTETQPNPLQPETLAVIEY